MRVTVTAMIMAGKRSGVLDPLAQKAGVAQKCVVPIRGKPLIEHVVAAVSASERVGEIRIVAHEEGEIAAIPLIARLIAEGRLKIIPGAFNLVDSVIAGAQGAQFPILITTADNVLVTTSGYEEFIDGALAAEAGGAAALARIEDVQAAHPQGQRRRYQFRDGGFSNCNTYWLGSEEALTSAEIFRQGGQFVKYPSRIAKAFGVLNLLRYFLGTGDREKLFQQVSRRFGFPLRTIVLSNGEFAIDVDNERTYAVADKLLAKREVQAG
ncbi:NTP transferase domain-containing protein [Altererythrobacter sp. MF3-039]|uniref:NTP transferase domain-containing protein n=1 Tax=Altererythrobacter sp. MF3-039 TaxID=3252901 RepID=UPI00390C737D